MSNLSRQQVEQTAIAAELMLVFAARTGLTSDRPPRRYLWTDAFAVCNFLALARGTGFPFSALATRLVDQVHQVLGRHRPDDARRGWISGLSESEGQAHPTTGGLRIGKPLPERGVHAPIDPQLEWERDGQYFHYLTRWMHALDQFARIGGHARAGAWARELAHAAHAAFADATNRRMVWKMSIDLSRPLVASMGQHDPLDGLITFLQLQAHRRASDPPDLSNDIREMSAIAAGRDWRTDDPLGLGGLLADAWRLWQLPDDISQRTTMLPALLDAAGIGLDHYCRQQPFRQPLSKRLAFRELGLAIGLQAVARMQTQTATPSELSGKLMSLAHHLPTADVIQRYWLEPVHQRSESWLAHEDINAVMLATSLVPSGYLDLR